MIIYKLICLFGTLGKNGATQHSIKPSAGCPRSFADNKMAIIIQES